jgi:molybdopterin-guanine dinucleotide biosynthesis protein A
MNGREKALMVLESSTLLERSLFVLDDVSDEVIVSLRDEEQVLDFSPYLHERKIVTDRIRNAGPLAGMLAGFKRADGDYVFTVACDMPYLNRTLIDMMFDMVGEHEALIPISEYGRKETLHAVYKKDAMLAAIESALEEGSRSILSPVSFLDDVIYLDSEVIRTIDRDFKSFVNVNTPEDMLKLE